MITFNPSTADDLEQISRWAKQDIDTTHAIIDPNWWVTGSDCFMAFRIDDSIGPTMYVRFDKEDSYIRMHVQFGSIDTVSKLRIVKAITEAMPALIKLAELENAKGFVFESQSPSLIRFMTRLLGFKCRSGSEYVDDYLLLFEEKVAQ